MSPSAPIRLAFVFPLVHRPLRQSFADQFERLSGDCSGHVFVLSSARHRDVAIGRFALHAGPGGMGSLRDLAAWVRQEIVLPLRKIRRRGVDAIVAYDPYTSGLAGLVLSRALAAKLVVELNGEYHTEYQQREDAKNPGKARLMRLVSGLVLRSAHAVKVLNASQEGFVRSRYPGKPVYRFLAFTATTPFQNLPTHDGGYFLSVGMPFHTKGVDVLIQAFRRVLERHPAARLRIMGYAPEPELGWHRELAEHDPRIEFLKPGWPEDVGEQMRGCVALVNAARSEAMGRVHLEAMACRKPVLATRTSGGLDCVEDGRTGLLCRIEDVGDLADKLAWILDHPGEARAMGERGFERLQREFSEERYVELFSAMVREVIGQAGVAQPRDWAAPSVHPAESPRGKGV